MSIKSVGSKQPVHDDRSALSDGRTDKAQYIVRSHQGMTTGTERSSVLGGIRKEKMHSERVAVAFQGKVKVNVYMYSASS